MTQPTESCVIVDFPTSEQILQRFATHRKQDAQRDAIARLERELTALLYERNTRLMD
jgi:hypothetical protein